MNLYQFYLLVIVVLVIAIASCLVLWQLLHLEPRQSIHQRKYHQLVCIPSISHHQHSLLILHHLNLFKDISNIVLIDL